MQGTEEVFRPMKVTVDLSVNMASLVICNDRPQSYGAPDFLLLSTKGIALEMYSERLLPNRRPDIGIQFEAESKVDFLNNSSGSWQQLMAFWPIDVHARISGSGSSTMSYSTEVPALTWLPCCAPRLLWRVGAEMPLECLRGAACPLS